MIHKFRYIALLSFLLVIASHQGIAQKGQPTNNGNTIGCTLYVPNAFTPNGDNINDRLVITQGDNCHLISYEMKVFDRWGRLVFEVDKPDAQYAWDGTFDGKELQKGVYIYNLRAKLQPYNGGEVEIISKQGTIVLIR